MAVLRNTKNVGKYQLERLYAFHVCFFFANCSRRHLFAPLLIAGDFLP